MNIKGSIVLFLVFGMSLLLLSSAVVAQECGIKFLTALYAKRIKVDMATTQSFTLKNTCNETITLKEYSLSGTVLTDEGEKPIDISEIRLGEVPGKEETKITVDINTVDVEPGKYSVTLSIVGDYLGNLVTATLGFEINVVGSVAPPSAAVVTVPSEVYKGELFMINASGIPSGATVSLFHPYTQINEVSVEQTETQWLWKGTINDTGRYAINVLISSAGVITIRGPYTIESILEEAPSEKVMMDLNPSNPVDGTKVRVSVLDEDTKKIVTGCDIYIDGDLTDEIVVTAKKTYEVRIECPDKEVYEEEFSVPALECFITLSKEGEIYTNEEIELTAFNSKTYKELMGVFTANGETISDKWEAEEGTWEIIFESDKFTCTEEITVEQEILELESTVPSNSIKPGTELTFIFNRETRWKIKNEGNVTVLKDEGERIDFTPESAGSYTIFAEDESFGTFTVKKEFMGEYGIYIGIITIFVIVGLVVWRLSRRRVASVQFGTGQPTPPGAVPVE